MLIPVKMQGVNLNKFSPHDTVLLYISLKSLRWDIKNEIIIQNNGGNVDLGYPVSIELENGEVLCVYYHNSAAHDSCYIEGATFKP